MTLEEYFGDWMSVIDNKELNLVLRKLSPEYMKKSICPAQKNVFKAFELCPYKDLKVVMLWQDPYPQKGVATGVLFGNNAEEQRYSSYGHNLPYNELSPSLEIVKESVINFEIPHNCIIFDPTLESWARQGILMINSAFTVEMNKVGSYTMLWRPFVSSFLKKLSERNTGIVYILFGKQAQTFKPYINKSFNYILEENHPAYYARLGIKMPSTIFDEASNIAKGLYNEPISWYNNINL